MPEFFSSDGSLLLQFAVIFAVLVVVLMAGYLVYRRMAGRGLSAAVRGGTRSRQPRLGIVDIYELDRQRQLILLRRDNVEHLLLVGGPNDVVVERNVQRGSGARLPAERVMRPEPAPDLEPGADGQPALPPSFEMPLVVAPPLPGSDAPPDARAPRLDPALFEPHVPGQEAEPEQDVAPEPASAKGRASRFLRRTPPPLVGPKPEVSPERAQPEPLPLDAVPPVMAAPEPRAVDPAVLSDMARQLEVALRRPSSAVTPPPGQARPAPPVSPPSTAPKAPPAPAAPAAPPAKTPSKPDPMAAAMAAPPPPKALEPELPAPVAPAPPPAAPASPSPSPAPMLVEAKPAAVPAPAPPAPPAPKPIPPAQPAPPQPAAPAKDNNPFSVEEIEAEFARLLGRPLDKKN